MKTAPLLYTAILFLVIRLVNDYPTGDNYLAHSVGFIAIELTGITTGSYLCFYLADKWARICSTRHPHVLTEYGVIILIPALLVVMIMSLSHKSDLAGEITQIVIPVVITALMSLWLYLFLKSRCLFELFTTSILKEKEARNAKTAAELQLLRSQYHPHFLFNMLNTIYFSIDENNFTARETVEHLANLLRAQLYDTDGKVPIAREISTLRSYIKLCRIRYEESLSITEEIDERYSSSEIHPHLLLPIVENAVKHSGGNSRAIHLHLIRTPGTLDFLVDNTLPDRPQTIPTRENNSGLGLPSLRKRLDLLYEGHYKLTTSQNNRIYSTHLHLCL